MRAATVLLRAFHAEMGVGARRIAVWPGEQGAAQRLHDRNLARYWAGEGLPEALAITETGRTVAARLKRLRASQAQGSGRA